MPLLGDPLDAIDAAEDRGRFAALAGDLRRSGGRPRTPTEALAVAERIGYPVLVRPHFVIGGRGMHVAHAASELHVDGPVPRRPLPRGRARARRRRALRRLGRVGRRGAGARRAGGRPLGRLGLRAAGPVGVARRSRTRSARSRRASRSGLGARGLLNLQLAVHGGRLWVLEANPRASRTVPFVAKATGVPLIEHSVRLLLGETLGALDLPERATPTRAWAKEAVFPSERFPGAATRGPEMRSTGEVMAGAETARRRVPPRPPRRRSRRRRGGAIQPSLQTARVS